MYNAIRDKNLRFLSGYMTESQARILEQQVPGLKVTFGPVRNPSPGHTRETCQTDWMTKTPDRDRRFGIDPRTVIVINK